MTETASRLGAALADRYAISRELGAGGMATVYLARDLKHDRDVAIKVLHADLGAVLGSERFLSEIRITAKLQHAHILPLLDSGEADGLLYYVMPVVTGESLRQRLEREAQLPITDSVRIASEVSSALDYAHRQGVIHRDIKPENILLHEGQALVADFGISLAVQTAGGQRMTQTGLSLGTPQYMSPEQAMGEKQIDARSDVYALGAVTYEMLTGEPPFVGATVQATLAKVMGSEPEPPSRVRKAIPAHVEDAVLIALAKLPADRFRSSAEFAAALAGTAAVRQVSGGHARGARGHSNALGLRGNRLAMALGAVAVVALGGAIAGWTRNSSIAPAPVARAILGPTRGVELPTTVNGASIAISRDGTKIAFAGRDSTGKQHVFLRYLDRTDPVAVPGAEDAGIPFFSPDGNTLGVRRSGALRLVSLVGGPSTDIPAPAGRGASWGDDGNIVFGAPGGLWQVAASGGTAKLLLADPPNAGISYVYPSHLPGAQGLLMGIVSDSGGGAVLSLADGVVTRLGVDGINLQYADPGLLTFGQLGGTVSVVPFDLKRMRVTGRPEVIVDQVLVRADGVARYALSRSGTLAHFVAGDDDTRELVIVDRQGRVTTLDAGRRLFLSPRFSPDARRVAFGTSRVSRGGSDVWMYSIATRSLQRFTADSVSGGPEWDPDGRSVVFRRASSAGTQLQRMAVDGGTQPTTVIVGSTNVVELAFVSEGRTVVYREFREGRGNRVLMAPLDSPERATELQTSTAIERSIAVAPDAGWLAFVSNESGSQEVYIRRLTAGGGRWRVSPNGGTEPRFARGGELFFRARDTVFVTRVQGGSGPDDEPRIAAPRALFSGQFDTWSDSPSWDVSADGTQFVMVRQVAGAVSGRIGLLLNWVERWRAGRK